MVGWVWLFLSCSFDLILFCVLPVLVTNDQVIFFDEKNILRIIFDFTIEMSQKDERWFIQVINDQDIDNQKYVIERVV